MSDETKPIDVDQVVRAMNKAAQVKYLKDRGWRQMGSRGPQSWRSPKGGDRSFSLAAAIRTAVSRNVELEKKGKRS
jgi:hypothetical protein